MTRNTSETISRDDFDAVLKRYPKHVKEGLEGLDIFRFENLPQKISERWQQQEETKQDNPVTLILKDELVELVTWKLKHGTFRPKLKSLVESNDEDLVNKIMHDLSTSDGTPPKERLQMLTQMKGIGPATASLVLSCIWPLEFPFFSDELFRWVHWDGLNADGTNAGIKAGKGWARPIGYTPKEYDSLIAKCKVVQERFSDGEEGGLSFLDLEKVAYVLGKEKVDISGDATFAAQSGPSKKSSTSLVTKGSKATKRSASPVAESTGRASRPKRTKK
jgi:hypothetical protein